MVSFVIVAVVVLKSELVQNPQKPRLFGEPLEPRKKIMRVRKVFPNVLNRPQGKPTSRQALRAGGGGMTAKDTSVRATMLRNSSKENVSPGGPEGENRKD